LTNVESALAARQASETKVRQFVADASHELRNPLAAIRGYAELTRRGREDLPEDTQFAMGRIESESERMSRLVEDLLLLARLDNGPALQLSDVELTDLLANATADAQVAGPDHEWDVEVPEEPVLIRADRFRIHQVIANLLANARTHTPAGTHVTASLAIDGMYAVVKVADDGPGISPALLPKVFERFVRADVSRVRKSGQSTGLGLAIVAAVVQAHGGTVNVTSRPGRTVFEVRLRRTA
ncbi:MAG TPA: HAMP domain-containing sensor histidine kinase, partial [Propionibacteriaceae bacterium]